MRLNQYSYSVAPGMRNGKGVSSNRISFSGDRRALIALL